MKAIIHQFDPQIYPNLLWIVIGATKASAMADRFEGISDMPETAEAEVSVTNDIINHKRGILIRFRSLKAARNADYVCHEACHAALEIFGYTGCMITQDNQEPFCYLAGWVASCIAEVAR